MTEGMVTGIPHYLEMAKDAAYEAGLAVMNVYASGDLAISYKDDDSPVTKADRLSQEVIRQRLEGSGLPILSEEGSRIDLQVRRQWTYYWLVDPLDGTLEFINRNGEFTVNIALMYGTEPAAGIIYVPGQDLLYGGALETGAYRVKNGEMTYFPKAGKRRRMEELLAMEGPTIIASRSHLTDETRTFIARFRNPVVISEGSSLKFIALLEGRADIYPRLGTTMEWDIAAGHAILNASNRGVYRASELQGEPQYYSELQYNKDDLRNPHFIAF